MSVQVITTRQAANHIRNSKGLIFTVDFIKRGNGQLRRLTGRTGVSKGVQGEARYDAASHNLIRVAELAPATRNEKGQFQGHEFTPRAFRSIGVEGIRRLAIKGQVYEVIGER
jgi:hypothetical protein